MEPRAHTGPGSEGRAEPVTQRNLARSGLPSGGRGSRGSKDEDAPDRAGFPHKELPTNSPSTCQTTAWGPARGTGEANQQARVRAAST